MHARPRRIAALLFALVAIVVLSIGGGAATAAPVPLAKSDACVRPAPRNDDTIHIQGCLTDRRDTPPKPVSGVKISVKDSSGKVVGTGTSDQTGTFDIPLPGKSIDVLGNTYEINIDTKTLPKGAALANPKQVSLKVQLKLDSDVYVTFPIGSEPAGGTGKFTQGLQLAVGGLVFSLLLAMASLGLSMIFGTTGLTNFAHGELITFGAIVAFGIDSLPGNITV
ncbi:MAG: ABC transporter permease subunit, partial [Nocardioidaceae bacterium]